jgi:hypothetical protein
VGAPPVVIVFGCVTFAMMLTHLLMIRQIKAAKYGEEIPYFGRGFGWAREIKNLHRALFPDSWTRDIFWGLQVVQWSLFALISIGIILSYTEASN